MTAFNKEVEVAHVGTLTFTFIPTHTPNGRTYFVSVEDWHGDTFTFTMKPKGNDWKIINAPKVPDWILTTEHALAAVINNHDILDNAE